MAFTEAQYTAAIDKMNSKLDTMSTKLNEVGPKAESTANKWYVPDFIADALIWCANKIIDLGNWLWKKIVDCMKGAAVPVTAFFDAFDWETKVRGKASEVAGSTATDALTAPKTWTGDGATAYTTAVKGQPTAATSIETSADKVAIALGFSALAGLAFYVALGMIIAKFIGALIAAIVALGSAVFSWAGAALIVEEAGVDSALIWGAISTLTTALGTQAYQMTVVKGEAMDQSAFPDGHWPKATA